MTAKSRTTPRGLGAAVIAITFGVGWLMSANVIPGGVFMAQSANSAAPRTGRAAASKQPSIVLRSQPTPPKAGDNNFEVTVKDVAGKPISDADVSLAFYMAAMPVMKMPEMRNTVALKHDTSGVYRGSGQVMMAGQWDVTIIVKRNGQEIGTKKAKLTAK